MLARVTVWKKAPFIRFLLPLITGIILQWELQLPVKISWIILISAIILLLNSFAWPYFHRYKSAGLNGIAIGFIFLSLGALLTWYQDIRHDPAWFGNFYNENNGLVITLKEPPVEKANSYKAQATVTAVIKDDHFILSKGDVIVYFKKDPLPGSLDHGSRIIFSKPLLEIKNAGNPGSFNYKRYCLFQGITYQSWLQPGEFIVLNERKASFPGKILFPISKKVLSILRSNIPGKKEQGLAEALLIGYKNDLDKDLVQSYSNTGVVHVIAISGLHLGLIYWLLLQLLKPLRKKKKIKWLIPVIVISGLWLFSLLAGGQPSVLRAAVMFTCIVLAENFSRKTSIYNTLAVSAFILLCINPYWLWDVGFQLSYSAVLSIIIFMQPVYHWFYIKNKILDLVWKLNAVSLAAQLLTAPLCVYHFHQFPNFFLLSNIVAVPLSSIIVLGEIFLCSISFFPFLSMAMGKLISWLIRLMNQYVERIEELPYSLWDNLQIGLLQCILLLIMIAGAGYWFLQKQKTGAWIGFISLLFFMLLRSISFWRSNQQEKLIVYNTPHHQAIDIINRRECLFIGDSVLLTNKVLITFHIRPSRIIHRTRGLSQLPFFLKQQGFFQWGEKRIMVLDKNISFKTAPNRIRIDLLVISKNPKLYFPSLFKTIDIKQVVFDGSVPQWKIKYWVNDCDSLNIPWHNVREKGAFVMNLN